MSNAPRWYLYHHVEGGLGTSLTPPSSYPNLENYVVTGPFLDTEIMDKFMEVHSANCKAKHAAKAKDESVGGAAATTGGDLA